METKQTQTLPNPRLCAVRALEWVFGKHRPLDLFIDQDQRFLTLSSRDKALTRAIVGASLRHLGQIDLTLSEMLSRPLPKQATTARQILRAGTAELLYMRSASHGVVNSFVQLASQMRPARPYKGLINAIFRRITREEPGLLITSSIEENIPKWPGEVWNKNYGPDTRMNAGLTLSKPPLLDLTVFDDPDQWAKKLGGTRFGPQTVRLEHKGRVEEIEGYDQGAWIVQDVSASLPVQILAPKPGECIADLCAAPGGKTMQMAAVGAHITAFDQKKPRLSRLQENLSRTGLTATLICGDSSQWRPVEKFDAVLLDAPCSATGIFRHHPDVLYNRRASDLPTLVKQQLALAKNAARFLKKGGRLLYCVCSAEPEEGEQLVATLLHESAYELDPVLPDEVSFFAPFCSNGIIRIPPGANFKAGGMDAFFIARFRKS